MLTIIPPDVEKESGPRAYTLVDVTGRFVADILEAPSNYVLQRADGTTIRPFQSDATREAVLMSFIEELFFELSRAGKCGNVPASRLVSRIERRIFSLRHNQGDSE